MYCLLSHLADTSRIIHVASSQSESVIRLSILSLPRLPYGTSLVEAGCASTGHHSCTLNHYGFKGCGRSVLKVLSEVQSRPYGQSASSNTNYLILGHNEADIAHCGLHGVHFSRKFLEAFTGFVAAESSGRQGMTFFSHDLLFS